MSSNKKYSAQIDYVTPEVEVIEIALKNSILVMSNEETSEEDLF
ncbi:MAG: hypothetical protein ACI3Y4_01165 [Candidatus Cryptobacteroides sp.]